MNLRMRHGVAVLTAVSLALTSACGTDQDQQDGAIVLRAVTGLSDQHGWWAGTMEPWMERVEQLTDGEVRFETFTGGELVEVPNEVEAIRFGTADVSLLLPVYQPDQFPMAEVTMLPLQHSDALIAAEAWEALLESDTALGDGRTFYESQFGDRGIKAWPASPTQEYSISTTGARLDSVDQVTDLALRTPSRVHEMYVEHSGMSSVTLPAVEVFDSLSRGAFDGAFYSIADWSGYGFQDLFMYTVTGVNFGHFNAVIGMNDDTWNDLPAQVQAAMDQAHEEIYLDGAREWMDRAVEMVEYNTAEGGEFVELASLDQRVQEHLMDGIGATWGGYADLLEEEGIPGRDAVRLWSRLLVEAGGSVPDGIEVLEQE